MRYNKSTLWMFLGIALTVAILIGCGGKGQPAEFNQTAGEMKEGPGVLTGEEASVELSADLFRLICGKAPPRLES